MTLDQVRADYNYPLTSPENSTYLVLDEKRCYFSVVEKVYSEIIKFGQSAEIQCDPKIILPKATSVEVIASIAEYSKSLFHGQNACFDKARLDEAHRSLISALKEIRLDANTSATSFYRQISAVAIRTFEQKANALGLRTLPGNCELHPEDFKIANRDGTVYRENGRFMECQDFVFYHLHEEQAFPYLFYPQRSSWPPGFALDPENFMPTWGYKLVTTPQPGDVVIYYSTLKGFTETKHWGIWNDNNCVTSKWGAMQAYEHNLQDVVIGYGNYVQFFRKRYKLGFQKALAEKIQAAKNGIQDFNHPATRSPLTSRGTLTYFIRVCADDLAVQMERTLIGSLYGRRVLKTYGEALLSKMGSITPSVSTDKSVVLDQFEAVVESTASDLTIDFKPISPR